MRIPGAEQHNEPPHLQFSYTKERLEYIDNVEKTLNFPAAVTVFSDLR